MKILTKCNIVTQDDIHPVIDFGARVIIFGESPNARAKVMFRDPAKRKYSQLDVLSEAKVSDRAGTYTIEGYSWFLKNVIGARGEESYLKMLVTPGEECEDCQ